MPRATPAPRCSAASRSRSRCSACTGTIGYHVDHGRDQGVLTAPHLLIVLGLQGIVSRRSCTASSAAWAAAATADPARCGCG
jgi:hypothetical protein